ncbi:G-protein coupled receptor Mth isoform X2 [Drosophila ficusphila]|uniref:G-protein coupled receptor Mth isoform X2 n=1 Tax=Drosophila ficusphila TaxID=30025 RepID=UPI0007E70316|nr:G-protein coupled receptor Mth isoform X2 [Drosophila ficusphila]
MIHHLVAAALLLLAAQKTWADIPDCDFFDTVDISAGQRLPNGSYLYDGLLIPAHLTGSYDFKLLPDDSKEEVKSHVRGCVCKLKPCVRFCCPHDHLIDGVECHESEEAMDEIQEVNVTLSDGSVVSRRVKTDLIVQWDLPMPCEELFYLDNQYEMDEWTLFENGTFRRHHDNAILNKREYCLQHRNFTDGNDTLVRIAPHNCLILESRTGQTFIMVTSLVCMLLTICVYLVVKKLQNLHGKCFICYMVSLFMGYLLLLLDLWELSLGFCLTAGFLGYFFVLAAFFWLSAISMDLWNTFSGNTRVLSRLLMGQRFLTYNAYAWGMPLVLTGVTYLADRLVENEDWNPRVGAEGHCWIYTLGWSAMLYFFGPMLLLILFNLTMFILTAIPIMRVRRDIKVWTNRRDGKQNPSLDKETYMSFLRLFIVMGLTWSMEILSYLLQSDPFWAKVFLVADYLNWSQGIIIFVLFILKRSTLKLLQERIMGESAEANVSEEEISLENAKLGNNFS